LIAQQVVDALAAISATEWIAVALALAYLVLAVRQNAWCWPFAAVSSALYLWLFATARLPMQAALQVFYIAMAGYGWYSWHHGRNKAASPRRTERVPRDQELRTDVGSGERPLAVTRWPLRWHCVAVVAVLVISGLNVALLRGAPAAVDVSAERWVAVLDAGIAWGSVLTTWMVARKVLENWLYWIVLDLSAAWLYGTQGLYATAALFVLYAVIAVRGYQSWRASMSDAARAAPLPDAR
jgi:nicotinamide mononucleotide transporter